MQLSAIGAPAAEHVTTTEQVVNLVSGIFNVLGVALTALGPTPLTGAVLGALFEDPAFSTALATAIPLLAQRPQNQLVALALVAAFSNPTAKPPPIPGQGQTSPGIGCTGLLSG